MLGVPVVKMHPGVAGHDERSRMPEESPVVPKAAQAIHVPKDEILNQVAIQIVHNESKRQGEQATEVSCELLFTLGNYHTKLDSITHYVEEKQGGPSVWISSCCPPIHPILSSHRECPNRQ